MPLMTDDERKAMLARLLTAQAARIMPLIGSLLDAWEQLPNDVRSDVEAAHAPFVWTITKIMEATEADD